MKKNRTTVLWLAILLLLSLFAPGCAEEPAMGTESIASEPIVPTGTGKAWYVSPEGSNSNDGKSPETPFASPQRAANVTKPGDVVYFMGGVYESREDSVLAIKRSGTAEAPITYCRYNEEKVIFKAGDEVWDAVSVTGSYIVVDGLTLMGISDEVTEEEGWNSYYAVLNQQDTGKPFDNAAVARTNTNGIGISGRAAVAAGEEPPHHITVRGCEVFNFPGGGITAMEADYLIFENNLVHDNMRYSLYGSSGISILNSADVDYNTTEYKNIVRGNVVYSNRSYVMCQNGRKWSDSNGIIIDYNKNTDHKYLQPYTGKTLVENNLCYQNGGAGILAFNSSNVDIFHNTCADNGQVPELSYWGNIKVNWSTDVRVVGNIAVCTREDTFTLEFGNRNHDVFFENNLHFSTVLPENVNRCTTLTGSQLESNLWADPCFVDIANFDFRLTEESPAVDAGTGEAAPVFDLNGAKRPRGNGCDLGAYESGFTGKERG